jgi:hypothetical protein
LSPSFVILAIGVTSAAVHTKNASLNSHNLSGEIVSSITSMSYLSLNNSIIVALVIPGRIAQSSGVYTFLPPSLAIKNIFAPGPSAILSEVSSKSHSSKFCFFTSNFAFAELI